MIAIGLDIGTTTISGVVMDPGQVLASRTIPNDAFLPAAKPWERIQDPRKILDRALSLVKGLQTAYPDAACLGVTGQMHGIVYLDRFGEPCSPLCTWQDGRGSLSAGGGETYASQLSRLTGYPMSTGFGLCTHYYNLKNGLVPEEAAVFCTIHDYVAMHLAGRTRPVTEPSDAASLGLFSLADMAFDQSALRAAGISVGLLPDVASDVMLGEGLLGLPVAVAIGDNQASFLGSSGGRRDCALVNLGTGGQFSAFSPTLVKAPTLETRPFPGGGFLLVGSSLCGGRAYALLEQLFRKTAELVVGQSLPPCYDALERMLEEFDMPENCPTVCTAFSGTRQDPDARASFTGLDAENLTPLHLTYGLLQGMVDELYEMYREYLSLCPPPALLVGSGNGLRKNPRLQSLVSRTFSMKLNMSRNPEEAACGAALYASRLC